METGDGNNPIARYSEPISPTLTPRGLTRLKENTGIEPETLLEMLAWGAYGIVCQIQPNEKAHIKHQILIIVYDAMKKQPCLTVLEKSQSGWELMTIYSTYEFHRRRNFVVIKPETIKYAIGAQKSFERVTNKAKRRKIYNITIVIIEKDEAGKRRSFSKDLGTVPKDEYDVYPSVEIFLNFFLTKKLRNFRTSQYSRVDILVKDRMDIVNSLNLQDTLW